MPRLIDADALVQMPWVLPNRMTRETALECFRNIVSDAPIIDAEPVRHAYWQELLGCGYTVCSACDFIPYSIKDKYCPHCGAKMDAKEE